MKNYLGVILAFVLMVPHASLEAAPGAVIRLAQHGDAYLMENDIVYGRFLELSRAGAYRQIDRDRNGSAEVDRGTWDQDAAGDVRLHSKCRALRPRAVFAGPLSVAVSGQENIEALPGLLHSIHAFLANSEDAVFDARSAADLPGICIGNNVATFGRDDLEGLVERIQPIIDSERTCTYTLVPLKNTTRLLFAFGWSVFRADEVGGVAREYRLSSGQAPAFYFALVDARTFAIEVGRWRPLHLPDAAH